jgi:hypothetical protein
MNTPDMRQNDCHAGRTGHRHAGLRRSIPAAFAVKLPPLGGAGGSAATPPPIQAIVADGMSGWQITVIADAAALLAVFLDRARGSTAAHRRAKHLKHHRPPGPCGRPPPPHGPALPP